jgi:hypothetical protein
VYENFEIWWAVSECLVDWDEFKLGLFFGAALKCIPGIPLRLTSEREHSRSLSIAVANTALLSQPVHFKLDLIADLFLLKQTSFCLLKLFRQFLKFIKLKLSVTFQLVEVAGETKFLLSLLEKRKKLLHCLELSTWAFHVYNRLRNIASSIRALNRVNMSSNDLAWFIFDGNKFPAADLDCCHDKFFFFLFR